MATTAQIDELKAHWESDSHWNIEDTEGFEDHHDELKAYHTQFDEAAKAERSTELVQRASELKCSIEALVYMQRLESKIAWLESKIDMMILNCEDGT